MAGLSNTGIKGFLASAKLTGNKIMKRGREIPEMVEHFLSGWAGYGWKIWERRSGKYMLEIDDIKVRGTMTVFELLIHKIRAIVGALAISQGSGKIKSVTISDDSQYYLLELEDDMSFVKDDFIMHQTFNGKNVKKYHVLVDDIVNNRVKISREEFDWDYDADGIIEVFNPPEEGDEIVQFGNRTNLDRQSAIYIHADETGQPAIDVMFGINSKDWTNKVKIRLGGDIPGSGGLKGFYVENGMIKGTDETGSTVYCIYPNGKAEFGAGSAEFNPDLSGHIAGGAINWFYDEDTGKYRCNLNNVVLNWNNLDEDTQRELKPYIGENGNWWLGDTDTGVKAEGKDGNPPKIGKNGNWWVWDYDLNKYVDSGDPSQGDDGKSPEIRDGYWWAWENGEWYNTGVKAEGKDGYATFKSIVFKRSKVVPDAPTGGSWANPFPDGWSDGIPAGDDPVYMSTRIFTETGEHPQQDAWTTPIIAADTPDLDFEFSSVKEDPGTPETHSHNWHNDPRESDIWMAFRKRIANVWGEWQVVKIKGEDATTYYTWTKYADSPTSGMSDSPIGKAYFGIAVNKTSPIESENYEDYTWQLVKGKDAKAPIIIDTYWAFWNDNTQTYIKSTFSAKGDDGKSPYIDGTTGTWWEWDADLNKYVDTGILPQGRDAKEPTIIDGFWAFWDYDKEKYVKSSFSSIGDNGKSPYADPTTKTWWEWDATTKKYVNTGIKAEGRDAKNPTIIDGFWAFWSYDTQMYIKSSFSAEGDDGHSPYIKTSTGTWWEWSPMLGMYVDTNIRARGEKGNKGSDGMIILKSEWKIGVEYFNNFADSGSERFLSVALVRDITVDTGWRAYRCKLTHVSTINNAPGNTNYWEEFPLNVAAIFTSLIIAKDAVLELTQTNQLIVRDTDNTFVASIGGGGYPLMVGGDTYESAGFAVSKDGSGKFKGEVEAESGKISGFSIEDNRLLSEDGRIEINGENSTVALRDQFGNIQTIIRPVNLPSTPSAYFASIAQKTASLSSFKVQKNGALNQTSFWESDAINLSTSQGESYVISVPSLILSATVAGGGSQIASFNAILTLYLQSSISQKRPIGEVHAFSSGGSATETVTLPPSQHIVTHAGNWRLRAELKTTMLGEGSITSSTGKISGEGTQIIADQIVNRSEIGNNGMVIATSANDYFFEVGSLTEFRHNSNIFQINNNYIRISRNGGATWTNL